MKTRVTKTGEVVMAGEGFKVGDKVEWLEGGSSIKLYGTILSTSKVLAFVEDKDGYEHVVKLRILDWQQY